MALVTAGSIDNDRVRLLLDVVANRVESVSMVNDADYPALMVVVRASSGTPVISEEVPPGTTTTRSLPGNRRFEHNTTAADWGFTIQPLRG